MKVDISYVTWGWIEYKSEVEVISIWLLEGTTTWTAYLETDEISSNIMHSASERTKQCAILLSHVFVLHKLLLKSICNRRFIYALPTYEKSKFDYSLMEFS